MYALIVFIAVLPFSLVERQLFYGCVIDYYITTVMLDVRMVAHIVQCIFTGFRD